MEFRDPYTLHNKALQTVRDRLAQHVIHKIPYHELSNARLTVEWQGRRENAFALTDCRLIRDYLALVAFELCSGQILTCHMRNLELLTRMARRHLNTIKTLPAPATSSAQNAEHLLTCAWLLGANGQTFGKDWSALLDQTTPAVNALLTAQTLHLHDLDTPLFGATRASFAALCQKLGDDLLLSLQASSLLVTDYMLQHKKIGHAPDWISLDNALAEERMAQSSGRLLEEFNRILETEQLTTQRRMALVRHQFTDYLADLSRTAALLQTVTDQLDRYDRNWFSRQFAHHPVHTENHVLICALAHDLRMAGEDLDHIEAFARALTAYTRKHQAPCAGMLDDEITCLAQNISESSILRALQRMRISDPDCPLSIRHRNHISDVIKRAEDVLAHAEAQTSAPPEASDSSLPSASVPGVGSANRSPWTI